MMSRLDLKILREKGMFRGDLQHITFTIDNGVKEIYKGIITVDLRWEGSEILTIESDFTSTTYRLTHTKCGLGGKRYWLLNGDGRRNFCLFLADDGQWLTRNDMLGVVYQTKQIDYRTSNGKAHQIVLAAQSSDERFKQGMKKRRQLYYNGKLTKRGLIIKQSCKCY